MNDLNLFAPWNGLNVLLSDVIWLYIWICMYEGNHIVFVHRLGFWLLQLKHKCILRLDLEWDVLSHCNPLMQFCVKQTIPLDSLKDDITLHQQVKYILLFIYIYIYKQYIFSIYIQNNSALGLYANTGSFFFSHLLHLPFTSDTSLEANLIFSTWYQPEKM